jgi:hypothetical protein
VGLVAIREGGVVVVLVQLVEMPGFLRIIPILEVLVVKDYIKLIIKILSYYLILMILILAIIKMALFILQEAVVQVIKIVLEL